MKYLILIYLFSAATVFSQNQQWVKTFNGSANNTDEALKIKTDPQGNSYVLGDTRSTGNSNDIGIVKYDAAGTQLWAAVYNGPANLADYAIDMTIDNSGNIYMTGVTNQPTSSYDMIITKYSAAGVQQWAQLWTGPGNLDDYSAGIYTDNSGNVYVTGYTEVTNGSNYNYITVKYNSAGVLQWAKQYNNPVNSSDYAYMIDGDGTNIYVTGTSVAAGTGVDLFTIKYYPNGDSVWTARYSGTNAINEIPAGIRADANGNVYVTARTQGVSSGTDYITIKYNSAGAEQWQKRYTSPGNSQDIPEGLTIDANGNCYVTGRTRINSSYNDFATVKYSSAGAEEWVAVYNNAGVDRDDYGYDVITDNDGNVYVTGNSQASGTNRDAVTIKYNSSGVEQWVARFDVTDEEETFSIALDAANNVYVTGYQSNSTADYLTIKYSQVNGITQLGNGIPAGFELSQNYPNPFNPVTNIALKISKSGYVSLTIHDITGKNVAVLVKEELTAGIYNVDFDASDLPSGIYFYTLTAPGFKDSKKMILIK